MDDYYVTISEGGNPKASFRLRGGPLEDFKSHTELFAAIGYAAACWARFEAHLDAILIHVNAYEHSDIIYNPEHPITFNNKVKLLKRWFNQHPALADKTEIMRKITSHGKELSQIRNDFLHFTLEDFNAPTKEANFHGLKWMGNNEFHARNCRMTIAAFELFARKINAGNGLLEQISRDLFTRESLDKLRKS
jgi:hypothetical protein